MNVELKKCPFCGGKAKLDKYAMVPHEELYFPENDGNWYYVWCFDCCSQAKDSLSPEEAVDAWNKRV